LAGGKVVNVSTCGPEGYDVDITSAGDGFGSPFALQSEKQRVPVVRAHRVWLLTQPALMLRVRKELTGKVLGCVCAPKQCHGDNYLWLCGLTPQQLLAEIRDNAESGRSRSVMGIGEDIDWHSIMCKLSCDDRSPRILMGKLVSLGMLDRDEVMSVLACWQRRSPHWPGGDKMRESMLKIVEEIGG
jgi:hypothetical protein